MPYFWFFWEYYCYNLIPKSTLFSFNGSPGTTCHHDGSQWGSSSSLPGDAAVLEFSRCHGVMGSSPFDCCKDDQRCSPIKSYPLHPRRGWYWEGMDAKPGLRLTLLRLKRYDPQMQVLSPKLFQVRALDWFRTSTTTRMQAWAIQCGWCIDAIFELRKRIPQGRICRPN